MRSPLRLFLLACLPLTGLMAQVPGALLTFSQVEKTISTDGGPLQVLHPNEIAFLPLVPGCPNGARSEKWSPRSCMHVMAGDEDGNGQYWNPSLFGSIDALSTGWTQNGKIEPNPRMVYWSPSAAMGNQINSPTNQNPPLRPGDMGRIKPDGTVEMLMSEELFRKATGIPANVPLDVDAFTYEPGLGIYFSLDDDALCQLCYQGNWVWVNDGSIFAIPWTAVTPYSSSDLRIQDVQAYSAREIANEGLLVNVYMMNSGITDRHGAAVTHVFDLESLEIDHGPGSQILAINMCGTVLVPDFLFSAESMTGGSIASTINYGQPAMGPCGFLGIPAPYGLQNGTALGLRQELMGAGPASYVNALALGTSERFVLEPVTHQLNLGPTGGAGTMMHLAGQVDYAFTFVDIVPSTLAPWVTIGLNLFPDWYCLNLIAWDFGALVNGFDSFATPSIPSGWSGKLIFQSLGFEVACTNCPIHVSTPCVIDVN